MEPWTPLTLTVRTPMFLSARPGGPAEMRIPSLRGVARFWFRALAAPVFETAAGTDYRALARAEAEVFGAARQLPEGANTGGPSRVVFRLRRPPNPTRTVTPTWLAEEPPLVHERPVHGIGYLLGQGFFQPASGGQPASLTCPSHFGPGAEAAIDLRIVPGDPARGPDAGYLREVAGISLWAASTFGGLGSRTRRGFGGFSLAGLDALSPTLTGTALPGRSHPAIRRLQDLVGHRHAAGWQHTPDTPALAALGANGDPWPETPTWSRWHVYTSTSAGRLSSLLSTVGRELRAFRAPVDRPGKERYKRYVTREYGNAVLPVTAGNPPADPTIRIAAFGLPLLFGTKAAINLVELADDDKPLRRASPLWIRLHPADDGRLHLLCHVFEARIGPTDSTLRMKAGSNWDTVTLDEATAYSTIMAFLQTPALNLT
jgi:CRISPR-associated protein Cmr1